MFITINDIIGEKTINLSYPIRNFDSSKEIIVVSMFSDSIQYEIMKPLGLKLVDGSEKQILNITYTIREINALVERKLLLKDLSNNSQIIKMNKLAKATDMIFNLDELDNSNNLEDGKPSNTLFMHYMFGSQDYMHFEPKAPQYKKLKNGMIASLALKIMNQNNNVITNEPGTTIALHIQVIVTHPREIDQNELVLVRFPNLGSDDIIIPGMVDLSFNIDLSSTADPKRTLVSNIGRAIIKKLVVKFEGNEILSIDDFDIFACYQDLWKTKSEKRDAIRQGIISNDGCMENCIKLRINAGDKNALNKKDSAIADAYKNKFIIPLDFEMIDSALPYYQAGLGNRLCYKITFNDYN